ncbi:hypothetical protein CEXT_463461 [Caerostris extrusa]|uniref:Uncharacterized protein n=1 Tax=Caerostris extrusa TaxID=172846 RepID=A0AAV4PD12_CAEEX|nr:hypothetical protein CEXT_463461 [Caerostris extrusa]
MSHLSTRTTRVLCFPGTPQGIVVMDQLVPQQAVLCRVVISQWKGLFSHHLRALTRVDAMTWMVSPQLVAQDI